MFIKDNFIHSTYSTPSLKNGRVAILKSQIIAYEEDGTGVKVSCLDAEQLVCIRMSYDDLQKALQETVA